MQLFYAAISVFWDGFYARWLPESPALTLPMCRAAPRRTQTGPGKNHPEGDDAPGPKPPVVSRVKENCTLDLSGRCRPPLGSRCGLPEVTCRDSGPLFIAWSRTGPRHDAGATPTTASRPAASGQKVRSGRPRRPFACQVQGPPRSHADARPSGRPLLGRRGS